MQLQEFQERQKKIAEMEAKLQSQDQQLATQQERIKQLHVSIATQLQYLKPALRAWHFVETCMFKQHEKCSICHHDTGNMLLISC